MQERRRSKTVFGATSGNLVDFFSPVILTALSYSLLRELLHLQFPNVQHNLMRNTAVLFVTALCLFTSSCHRPVAYFQRTPHPAAARVPIEQPPVPVESPPTELVPNSSPSELTAPETASNPVASREAYPTETAHNRVQHRMLHIQSMLVSRPESVTRPNASSKSQKPLRLGNRIRQSLGMPLRKELNWWQRISWKLKASVIILVVAVLFAILHVTILAIIFGIIGALLMISGLKRSFKVRRPWF